MLYKHSGDQSYRVRRICVDAELSLMAHLGVPASPKTVLAQLYSSVTGPPVLTQPAAPTRTVPVLMRPGVLAGVLDVLTQPGALTQPYSLQATGPLSYRAGLPSAVGFGGDQPKAAVLTLFLCPFRTPVPCMAQRSAASDGPTPVISHPLLR